MDEESGSTQVKRGSPMTVLSSTTSMLPNDACISECSKNGSVCVPICFLVREQAKSQIAIQNLQKRINSLEGVQDDVISAISEVHEYLSGSADNENLQQSTSPKNAGSGSAAPSRGIHHLDVPKTEALLLSPMRTRRSSSRTDLASSLSFTEAWKSAQKKTDAECSISTQSAHQKYLEGVRVKDSAPESDKQDSGLESDCREQGQESNPPQNVLPSSIDKCAAIAEGCQDELMELLDEIGEKSEILRQNLSTNEEINLEHSPRSNMEMSKMQLEHLGLHHMLSNIKGERDVLRSRIDELETTTDELATEKKDLEQRFVSTLLEKHKLEAKLQGYDVGVAATASVGPDKPYNISNECASEESKSSSHPMDSSSRRFGNKVNSADVSAVLKETNAVDLQKQVLTYMMENRVLHTKLDQMDQMLSMKDVEKDCIERVHREEIRQYMCEIEQLRLAFEEQKMETTSLRAKVRMLERVLQSVTVENRELNVLLGESMYLKETLQKGRLSMPRPPASSPVARYSLPAQNIHEEDVNVRCAKSKLLPNTSSFLDVTVEDPDASDNDLAFTIGPFGFSQRKSSTPMVPSNKLEKPNFLDARRSPIMDLPSTSGGCSSRANPSSFRKSGKRLTFSSMKPLVHSTNLGFSAIELARSKDLRGVVADSCDRPASGFDSSAIRQPPDVVRNIGNDPKKFPFYTILEKLKASSDYKLPSRSPVRQEDCEDVGARGGGERIAPGCKAVTNNNIASASSGHQVAAGGKSSTDRKCNSPTNSSQESKEKKSSSKSLHRRMHNIFDRITAETDDAVI